MSLFPLTFTCSTHLENSQERDWLALGRLGLLTPDPLTVIPFQVSQVPRGQVGLCSFNTAICGWAYNSKLTQISGYLRKQNCKFCWLSYFARIILAEEIKTCNRGMGQNAGGKGVLLQLLYKMSLLGNVRLSSSTVLILGPTVMLLCYTSFYYYFGKSLRQLWNRL